MDEGRNSKEKGRRRPREKMSQVLGNTKAEVKAEALEKQEWE